MSGILIEQIKKNDQSKKREKTKFFASLFVSNFFVAFLFIGFQSKPASCKVDSNINPSFKLHPNYKMIIAPLTLLVDRDPNAIETNISLLNKNKKIIVKKAFLHDEVKSQTKESFNNQPRFKIEIPDNELINIKGTK